MEKISRVDKVKKKIIKRNIRKGVTYTWPGGYVLDPVLKQNGLLSNVKTKYVEDAEGLVAKFVCSDVPEGFTGFRTRT